MRWTSRRSQSVDGNGLGLPPKQAAEIFAACSWLIGKGRTLWQDNQLFEKQGDQTGV